MSRGTGPLPDGWDESIPEGIWSEALIAALRSDLSALGSARVRDTLRRWRQQARTAPDPELRAEAAAHLRAAGDALAHVPELGARPKERIASVATPAGQLAAAQPLADGEEATGDHIEVIDLGRRSAPTSGMTSGSAPPRGFGEEDEPPTMLRELTSEVRSERIRRPDLPRSVPAEPASEALPKRPQVYRAARIDPLAAEYDEKPTGSISIPDELAALHRSATEQPTLPPPIRVPDEETNKLASRPHEALDELGQTLAPEARTVGLAAPADVAALPPALPVILPPPPLPAPAAELGSQSTPPPVPIDDGAELVESKPSSFGLAPKPGIVRRSPAARRASPARPRAAMQQVRALHAVVVPLCEELIPLSVERRSRRFWARWREVAGDRGVRREFVESLLTSAKDVRTLVCELIAEVQTVNVRSVYALVEKLESTETQERPTGARPGATPDRQRGPLVGAQIRVEGVSVDDREE